MDGCSVDLHLPGFGAGLAGVMFFWICGKKYVQSQVDKGRSSKFTDLYYPICKYIYVPICVLVLDSRNRAWRNRLNDVDRKRACRAENPAAGAFLINFQIYKSD